MAMCDGGCGVRVGVGLGASASLAAVAEPRRLYCYLYRYGSRPVRPRNVVIASASGFTSTAAPIRPIPRNVSAIDAIVASEATATSSLQHGSIPTACATSHA